MLLEKYRPDTYKKIIGNKIQIENIKKILENWNIENNKGILLSGKNGIGKTLIIDLLAKYLNYNIIHYEDKNDDKNDDKIDIVKQFNRISFFDKKKYLLLIDHLDDYKQTNISYFIKQLKISKIPIVFICNERYSQIIKPLIQYCFDIKLVLPNVSEIFDYIQNICSKEKLNIKKEEIINIINNSNRDIRNILNNLYFYKNSINKNKDIFNSNIFELTNNIFSQNTSINEKVTYYFLDKELSELIIQENYISNILKGKNELCTLENISYSSRCLSDMFIFNTYNNLENYSCMSCIQAVEKCHNFNFPKFTNFLGNLSKKNKNKNIINNISQSIIKLNYTYFFNFRIDVSSYFIIIFLSNLLFEKKNKNSNYSNIKIFDINIFENILTNIVFNIDFYEKYNIKNFSKKKKYII